mmetsp:Transcript_29603/g.98083  ORF Transcript_29603/g.98083 Transcript_29603/m.98083 type:complete len:397 (-) Transcript_29603:912-2102(-)
MPQARPQGVQGAADAAEADVGAGAGHRCERLKRSSPHAGVAVPQPRAHQGDATLAAAGGDVLESQNGAAAHLLLPMAQIPNEGAHRNNIPALRKLAQSDQGAATDRGIAVHQAPDDPPHQPAAAAPHQAPQGGERVQPDLRTPMCEARCCLGSSRGGDLAVPPRTSAAVAVAGRCELLKRLDGRLPDLGRGTLQRGCGCGRGGDGGRRCVGGSSSSALGVAIEVRQGCKLAKHLHRAAPHRRLAVVQVTCCGRDGVAIAAGGHRGERLHGMLPRGGGAVREAACDGVDGHRVPLHGHQLQRPHSSSRHPPIPVLQPLADGLQQRRRGRGADRRAARRRRHPSDGNDRGLPHGFVGVLKMSTCKKKHLDPGFAPQRLPERLQSGAAHGRVGVLQGLP